ncbi:MAG: T9SS type A sorting domain-containing protein [Candidatus Eisenbacteria bacterium]|nr:T9SS type A sorting domain-containing protein [Candidatus Eisenbacteria bacterium]
MNGWRKTVGALLLTLICAVGLVPSLVPSANAAQTYVTPLTNHGVRSGYVGNYLTRLSRVFFSRGAAQDSATYVVHNKQAFCVGRLDVYSNVQDTVKAVKVTDKNDNIGNIDEVRIYVDTNGNNLWDSADQLVATSPANLAFTGPAATDSIATFITFSQTLTVPANTHWKSNVAGSWPLATAAGDSLAQTDPHLGLFVVYTMAQQVTNGSKLRIAFQGGASGVVLNSVFQDSTMWATTGIFNNGSGSWLLGPLENDSTVTAVARTLEAGATYTATAERILPWAQANHYGSPSLNAVGQPALNKASQQDTNVPILYFGLQAPDTGFASSKSPGPAAGLRLFGRGDTTRVASGLGAFKGNLFDSLITVTVTSENTNDIDVKTVKLWLKGTGNTADTIQTGDTLMAVVGGTAGATPFSGSPAKATLTVGSGSGVGSVLANGNTRFAPGQSRNYLVTYDMNSVGRTHNGDVLDVRITQFDIFSRTCGYTPPVDVAVDSAQVTFLSLPFTVWIDTVTSNRTLRANSFPDSTTNMSGILVKGVIDMGAKNYGSGLLLAPEVAQVKVKNASSDIDSLVVDLRAFGHSMRYNLPKTGWRPLGTDTVWADTFSVLDGTTAYNDAWGSGLTRDRYAADTYNRPTVTVSNGNTGFLAQPDGPYTVANTGAITGMAFPKWYAYSRTLLGVGQVDSGWAPTGFPGDSYAGPYSMIPVDSWVPNRVTDVSFAMADSGKLDMQFAPSSGTKDGGRVGSPRSGMRSTAKNAGGGAWYVYAQSNWLSGAPSGDINWATVIDTIPWNDTLSISGNVSHRIRDLFGTGGNPATKVVKFNQNAHYLFGVRTRDNGGNLELNTFYYSTFADTLAPAVNLVSPTRQCGVYGPSTNLSTGGNHHLYVYAVVDSSNGPDISGGSVRLHIRFRDVDPSTPGNQPGPWDDANIDVNEMGLGSLPRPMDQVGSSYWFMYQIASIDNSTSLQDDFELTVTASDVHGNFESPQHSYERANSLIQGGLNNLCFVWDDQPPVCELIKINGQETSSGVLPIVDTGVDSVSLTVRVTDAVSDRLGLPFFFRSDLGGDVHTYGWLHTAALTHEVVIRYPSSGAVATSPTAGGFTGSAYVFVRDSAGNECSSTKSFYLKDTSPPTAHFTAPLMNTRLALPYTISLAASDNAGLGAAVLTLWNHATSAFMDTIVILPRPDVEEETKGKGGPKGTAVATQTYSYSWNRSVSYTKIVGMANDGQYDIKATVYDLANNTVTTTTTFIYDALAPTLALAIVDPVTIGGRVTMPTTVTFKATPQGPYATDVTSARFFWKRKTVADEYFSYTSMGTVNTLRDGAYWLTYGTFPSNDSIDVRVIGFDAAGNMAYDSDADAEFDPGTFPTALATVPPSAVQFYTTSGPAFALWKVTDVTSSTIYYPSTLLGGSGWVYASGNDSLYVNPQDNANNSVDAYAEYTLTGPNLGAGSNVYGTTPATIQLGHVTVSPYNFGFGLSRLAGLQTYLQVNGYWQGTLTVKIYDRFGGVTSTDAIQIGVTNVNPNQAVVTAPNNGCVVYGDVSFSAMVIDASSIRKVRFDYKSVSGGSFTPFDSMLTAAASGSPKTYTGVLHTIGLLADGQYLVRAAAIDSAGNFDPAVNNISVIVDNAGPALTMGPVVEPLGGGTWIGGGTGTAFDGRTHTPIMSLSATVTRSIAPVTNVAWQAKLATVLPSSPITPASAEIASNWLNLGSDANTPYALSYLFNGAAISTWTSQFGNVGKVQLRATVTDNACSGARTVATPDNVLYNIDFNAPRAFFQTVAGQPVTAVPVNVTAGTNVALVAATYDDVPTAALNVGVDSVWFHVYNGSGVQMFDVRMAASQGVSGAFTTLWNTTGLAAGLYTVYFQSWDNLHNFSEVASTTVLVSDQLSPVASIAGLLPKAVYAVSYDKDVNDVQFQARLSGAGSWTNVGISTQVFRGTLTPAAAKGLGNRVVRKLANGNVAWTLWKTTFDAAKYANGTYEFRAVAKDTAANSDPTLAPVTSAALAVSSGLANWTMTNLAQIANISFASNETDCDSALVQVTTDGTGGVPAVLAVERAVNTADDAYVAYAVAMRQNTINSTLYAGSVPLNTITSDGGLAWVFAGLNNGLVTDLEMAGLTAFSVTPSLGSYSTIRSLETVGGLPVAQAYFPPASVSFTSHALLLPTDMPQPQPDVNRIRGVPSAYGNIMYGVEICGYNDRGLISKQSTETSAPSFLKPVQLVLKYGTPLGANTANALTVALWDFDTGAWDLNHTTQVTIDPSQNLATAWVTEAGYYAVVEKDFTVHNGNITITDVKALPGEMTWPAHLQMPVNGFVDARPCFSALINHTFGNDKVDNVMAWMRPVGGNYIKIYDYKTSFTHCGLDDEMGYESGSGFMNICYEVSESEGCFDNNPGNDDGAFPSLKTGNYQLKVAASSATGDYTFVETQFNVDANGPTVTNLTPVYQGNNPVIRFSASDAGAGLSATRMAVDVFVQEFDRDNASLRYPHYKGTLYNNNITRDSSRTADGVTTWFFSAKTNFDLKDGDHLRAVAYGGMVSDWFVDSSYHYTDDARQYHAAGGVKDSLNNGATPLEINTTINLNFAGPTTQNATGICVGPNPVIRVQISDNGNGVDKNSLVIAYKNVTTGATLATHRISDVSFSGDLMTDATSFNLADGTKLQATLTVGDNGTPKNFRTATYDFTVDASRPVVTLATGANISDGTIKLDIASTDCNGDYNVNSESIQVLVDGASWPFTYDAAMHQISMSNPGYGKTLVVNVTDNVGNVGTFRGVTQSQTLAISGDAKNYPNPFDNKAPNNTTTIVFGLTKNATVDVTIFDLAGNTVRTKHVDNATPQSTWVWDGRTDDGKTVARGVYLGRIKASDGSRTATAMIKIAVAR